jgi:hypothetical protein
MVNLSLLSAPQYSSVLMHVIQQPELNIVTDWAVARRRRSKHVPTKQYPTIEGRLLLGNRPVNIYHRNNCATIE